MRRSRWNLALALLSVLMVAAPAAAQRSQSLSTGIGLSIDNTGASTVHLMGGNRIAVLSPQVAVAPAGVNLLLVVDKVLDAPFSHLIAVQHAGIFADRPSDEMAVLDATTVAVPSPGPDGKFRSRDDEFILISGLDFPAAAQQRRVVIGDVGARADTPFMVLADGSIAWLDRGNDEIWNTGDEVLRVVSDPRNPAGVTSQNYTFTDGIRSSVVDLGNSRFILTGSKFYNGFASGDSTFYKVEGVPGFGLQVDVRSLSMKISAPLISKVWPQRAGEHAVAYPGAGADGFFATQDDVLVVIDFEDPAADAQIPVGVSLWGFINGTGEIGYETDGTIVAAGWGADHFFGTADDVMYFMTRSGAIEVMPVGASLVDGGYVPDFKVIEGDVTIAKQFGVLSGDSSDDGVAVFRKSASGARSHSLFNLGQVVTDICGTGRNDAFISVVDGTMSRASGLDTPTPYFEVIAGELHDFAGELVAVNRGTVVAINRGPQGLSLYDDEIKIWTAPSSYRFGESTQNGLGYSMELTSNRAQPRVGESGFHIVLNGAPENSAGYMVVSFKRESWKPVYDAEILVSLEEIAILSVWPIAANGVLHFPIVPPADPNFAGIAVHAQFLALSPNSPRGFELSHGLTLQF